MKPKSIMVWLAWLSVALSGAMQVQAASASTESHLRTMENHGCPAIKSGQIMKVAVSSARLSCFSIQIVSGEAKQLTITQPVDLEIHVRGRAVERLVDGFDMGNETITLQTPGFYRVEISKVKMKPNLVMFAASVQSLPLQQAAAWEQAEQWATMSKRSRKMESINESLALWKELGDTSSVARTYLKRESVLRGDHPADARANAEQALELCRVISDLRCTAEAANNSGWDSLELGDIDRAKQRLEEATRDWGKLHDPVNAAKTRSNLGLQLLRAGDFNGAIINLDSAERELRTTDRVGYGYALNNLGLCYQSLAEYGTAQGYFERAIERTARNNPSYQLRLQLNLGRTYMMEGRLPQAQSLLEHVLLEARRLAIGQETADVLRNLGQTLWKAGQTEQARAQFEEALQIDQSNGNVRGESSALHYLGLVAQHDADLSSARSFLMRAVQIRQKTGLHDDAADSLSVLAELEFNDGKFDAAQDYAGQALKLLESVRSQVPSPALRASFYSRKRQFFDLLVEMSMTPATPQANVEGLLAAERGRARALMDLLAGGSLLPQLPKELAERRENIQQHIDYLAYLLRSGSPERQDELRQKIEQFVAEKEAIEAQIEAAVGSKLGQPLASIEEIQRNSLPPDSALLEFHLGAHKSYLWLVDAQQVRAYSLPPASFIEAQAAPVVKNFGRILERRRSPATQAGFEQALSKLSATLLGELSGVQLPRLLILVPDGILHALPFAALKPPGISTPLGLAHDLVQVPSAAYLTFGKQPRPLSQFPKAIMAMVDPVFSNSDPRVPPRREKIALKPDISLARLPFNFEIQTIEALTPKTRRKIFRGFDASRGTLSRLNLADFGVLHFSTHAIIDDSIPELSRITLSLVDHSGQLVDGSLRPDQLAQWHLNGSTIVLSACDTALGKQVLGEGLVGLTSSLLYAGGTQLVLTLTEIDAEGSSHFLSEVYRRYLPGANSMEHSITLARRSLAHDPQFSDPYYWASFIVVGRPRGEPDMAANPTE